MPERNRQQDEEFAELCAVGVHLYNHRFNLPEELEEKLETITKRLGEIVLDRYEFGYR